MYIRIFNDDPDHTIFPMLEVGQGKSDQWMQAWFGVTNTNLASNPYPRNNTYRLYINPVNGIAPHTGIQLTLPLYTQIATSINPNPPICLGCDDTFIEWWTGGNIQLYTSSGPQPPGVTDALLSQNAKAVQIPGGINPAPALPSCIPLQSMFPGSPPAAPACEPMGIVKDTAGLPKYAGSQLLEYTLGAVNANIVPTNVPVGGYKNYWMDTSNLDFDVSYVNVAWAPAAIGVLGNNQVGYTGTPQTIDDFTFGVCPPPGPSCSQNQRNGGLTYFMNNAGKGWPQFQDGFLNINRVKPGQYPNGLPPFTFLKYPSLLEVFARLTGVNAPTDLAPLLDNTVWKNPSQGPIVALQGWPVIAGLFTNWTTYAGSVASGPPPLCAGAYRPGIPINPAAANSWCTAILAQKALLTANYEKYLQLFPNTCQGTPVKLTDAALVSHLYGFTPWVEANPGAGCGPKANLLQDTPGYCVDRVPGACPTVSNPNGGAAKDRDYTNYHIVKTAYDQLNYDLLMRPQASNNGYLFNPYNALIHNANPNLAIPCAYGYSVDDAQGNIQAEGVGFIVDIGSVANLENPDQCSPPINISLGSNGPGIPPAFVNYQVCNNIIKPVIPGFTSFAISAKNPSLCPINVWDGKNPPPGGQPYTFTINTTDVKKSFPFFSNPATSSWRTANHAIIACDANANNPYSSKIWCCNSQASSGIFAFSQSAETVNKDLAYNVVTQAPFAYCTSEAGCVPFFGNSTPCNPPYGR
jgi:hypothetical protein